MTWYEEQEAKHRAEVIMKLKASPGQKATWNVYKFAINYNISSENYTYTSCEFFRNSEEAIVHFRKAVFLYADIQYVLKINLK